METVFICSVGIYRCEKSSSIKININMTQNFDMLHSDMYYILLTANEMIGALGHLCPSNSNISSSGLSFCEGDNFFLSIVI